MTKRKRTSPSEIEALAEALDSCTSPTTDDPELNSMLLAAGALAPSVRPREAFRSAMKDRLRRDFVNGPSRQLAERDQADVGDVPLHTVGIVDPDLGQVQLADLEQIDSDRAAEITAKIAVALPARKGVRKRAE